MTATPTHLDLQNENNELLRELVGLRNDVTVYKARLDEALTELARYKVECFERRKLMIKAQNESLVRVKIEGVIK